jgi:hypothetical protein
VNDFCPRQYHFGRGFNVRRIAVVKLSDYNARAAGIAWIGEEDYAACLAIFEDGDKFEGGWKEWIKRAEKLEAEMKAQGYIVERVYIDPDTFPDWCRRNGVGTGREGRLKFGAESVAEKYGRNQS